MYNRSEKKQDLKVKGGGKSRSQRCWLPEGRENLYQSREARRRRPPEMLSILIVLEKQEHGREGGHRGAKWGHHGRRSGRDGLET